MRYFICPHCDSPTLAIAQSISLPPDARSDDIDLQIVQCTMCQFAAMAVYEESRRGGLDSDDWNHTGYHVPLSVIEEIASLIRQCPDPQKPRCRCYSHDRLGDHTTEGYWRAIPDFATTTTFVMR